MELPAESAATRPVAAGALLVALGALLFGAVFFGGGSGDAFLAVGGTLTVAVAALALCGAALGRLSVPHLDRAALTFLGAAVALVAWTGISITWSIAGDRSWSWLGKGLVYLSFVIVGLIVASCLAHRATRITAGLLTLVIGLALGWALLGRVVPGLFPDGGRIARLRNPVGYWNGLALLAGAALSLGLWRVGDLRGRLSCAQGALLLYGAVLVLFLTQSRAGILAGAAVLVVWLLLAPERLAGGVVLVVAGLPAALVAGWVFTRPALVDDGVLRSDRARDGAYFAALALLGAAIVLVATLRAPLERLVAERARTLSRALVASAGAVVLAGAIAFTASVGNPVAWASDQLSRGECVNTPGRLTELCANNRLAWWEEAWDVVRANPAGGSGAGTFEIARKRFRETATDVTQPHSVPLQLLADLGPVGFLLGFAALLGALGGVVASIRRLRGPERSAAVALLGLPAAYGVHMLVDYDLDFVALTAPMLVALAVLLATGRPAAALPGRGLTIVAAVVSATVVVAVLVTPALAEREVDRATTLLDDGRPRAAERAADRARTLDPLSLDPLYAAAEAADERGNRALAAGYYRRATELQPENPEPWFTLGLYEYVARGDLCAAYYALNSAYTLDPNGRRWVRGGPLDVARDAVDNGACEPA